MSAFCWRCRRAARALALDDALEWALDDTKKKTSCCLCEC